jgi:putative transposase
VKTPVRSPKANAIAERFLRTIRTDCLDWLLILNRPHLDHLLQVYVDHDNTQRPHRAHSLQPPDPTQPPPQLPSSKIHRRDRLSGLLHDYYRTAA